MLRRLAIRASLSPIEVIVTIFILVTLAYFQLLHAVTHSHFFEPLKDEAAGLAAASRAAAAAPAAAGSSPEGYQHFGLNGYPKEREGDALVFVRRAGAADTWVNLAELTASADGGADPKLDAQSLFGSNTETFFIEHVFITDSEAPLSKGHGPLASSAHRDLTVPAVAQTLHAKLQEYEQSKGNSFGPVPVYDKKIGTSAYAFGQLYSDSIAQDDTSRDGFLSAVADPAILSAALNDSLARIPRASKLVSKSVQEQSARLRLLPVVPEGDLLPYAPNELKGRRYSAGTDELRSIRWMAYAVRALVVRFWALIRVSAAKALAERVRVRKAYPHMAFMRSDGSWRDARRA